MFAQPRWMLLLMLTTQLLFYLFQQTTIAVARNAKYMTSCVEEIFPGKDPPHTEYLELRMVTVFMN